MPEAWVKLALGWLCRVLRRERNRERVCGAFPHRTSLARDADRPVHEVEFSIAEFVWFSVKTERVVFAPLFSARVLAIRDRGRVPELDPDDKSESKKKKKIHLPFFLKSICAEGHCKYSSIAVSMCGCGLFRTGAVGLI